MRGADFHVNLCIPFLVMAEWCQFSVRAELFDSLRFWRPACDLAEVVLLVSVLCALLFPQPLCARDAGA